jgi:hypothetical protein
MRRRAGDDISGESEGGDCGGTDDEGEIEREEDRERDSANK